MAVKGEDTEVISVEVTEAVENIAVVEIGVASVVDLVADSEEEVKGAVENSAVEIGVVGSQFHITSSLSDSGSGYRGGRANSDSWRDGGRGGRGRGG